MPTVCSLNIFLTQKLTSLADILWNSNRSSLPELSGLDCSVFWVNQHRTDVLRPSRMYQCLVLFFHRQVIDIANREAQGQNQEGGGPHGHIDREHSPLH